MGAKFINGNVRSACPGCGGSLSTFEFRSSSREHGSISEGERFFTLMRCAGCGRGGLATLRRATSGQYVQATLEEFYPAAIEKAPLPRVPQGIEKEFREAEVCASVRAWRAASALLRSVLEKTLIANGYSDGTLAARIDAAATDGVITTARKQRAHEDIRVLGNDILHDEWRAVNEDEYTAAHLYAQRILEDFYDNRSEVEKVLTAKGRSFASIPRS